MPRPRCGPVPVHRPGPRREAQGWLLLPTDLPTVTLETVVETRQTLGREGDIVRPVCHGRPGHPAGFDARFGAALIALLVDRGAQPLIAAKQEALTTIETDDADCVRDVGTSEYLAAIRRSAG